MLIAIEGGRLNVACSSVRCYHYTIEIDREAAIDHGGAFLLLVLVM